MRGLEVDIKNHISIKINFHFPTSAQQPNINAIDISLNCLQPKKKKKTLHIPAYSDTSFKCTDDTSEEHISSITKNHVC